MRRLLVLGCLLASSPAWAQRFELTPLASFTTEAAIDRTAPGVQDLTIDRGFTWGGQAGYFFTKYVGLEALWTYQSTGITMSTASGSAELFEMTTNQILGNVVYELGGREARVSPFVFAGLGATFFSARDLDSEQKLAWTVGAGLKWFLSQGVGLRVQARYNPTELRDSASTFCGPFGFCQESLERFEVAAGAVFRF